MIDHFNIEHWINIQANLIGYRPSGSPGLVRLLTELKDYFGMLNVPYHTSSFPVRYFKFNHIKLFSATDSFYALPYVGCPPFFPYPQKATARGYLKETADFNKSSSAGCIALVKLNGNPLVPTIMDLQDRGYAGIIFISTNIASDSYLRNLITPLIDMHKKQIPLLRSIPILTVSSQTGQKLKNLSKEGIEVNMDIEYHCLEGMGENLHIVMGAAPGIRCITHVDSPFEREDIPGANDNGSGVAVFCELIRLLKNNPGHLCSKGIEFIFYDNEEYNLFGCLSLLLDLNAFFKTGCFEQLWDELKKPGFAYLKRIEQKLPLLEIDAVGKGDRLLFGASDVEGTKERLLRLPRVRHLKKILLNRNAKGNVQCIKSFFNFPPSNREYFLTLGGVEELVHTPHDTSQSICLKSLYHFTQFLYTLLPYLL